MARRPEKEIRDPLKPYTDTKEIRNPNTNRVNNNSQKYGLAYNTNVVLIMVSAILTRIPYTLLFGLPGILLGAFSIAPKVIPTAYSK